MAHEKFKDTCTGRTLRIANYVALGLLILGWVFRFVYMFTDEEKTEDYSGFWFFLETLVFGFFIGCLAVSLSPNESNKQSQIVRQYFRVLDFDFGRGAFIFYLSMQMCEVVSNGEVVYSVFAVLIALVDMYLGFPVFKESLMAVTEDPQSFGGVNVPESNAEAEEEARKYNYVASDSSRDAGSVALDTVESTEFSAKK